MQSTTEMKSVHLVHIGPCFGGRLHVADAPLIGSGFGFLRSHLPPVLQVGLISDQQEGHVFILLYSEDLLSTTWHRYSLFSVLLCTSTYLWKEEGWNREIERVYFLYQSLISNRILPEVGSRSERLGFSDGEHTEEALSAAEVVIPNGSIVFLPCCVQNINLNLLSIQHHFLPVAVSFSGLIVFHKLRHTP